MKYRIVKRGEHYEIEERIWFFWVKWTDGEMECPSVLAYDSIDAAEKAIEREKQRKNPVIVKYLQ